MFKISSMTKAEMSVEVGFRPLIPPRAILKVPKFAYLHFITLIIFIYSYMHYIMIIYIS